MNAGRGLGGTAAMGIAAVLAFAACTQRPTLPTTSEGRTLESIASTAALDSRRASGYELIQSPGRPAESLLWLRALAVETVEGPAGGKFDPLLDCELIAAGECRYRLTQNSAEAVIVSRLGLEQLRPIRGPLDVERLERYITWAARPESLTVKEARPGRLEIHADLGPNSAILVRRDFDRPWRVEPQIIEIREDPLGYLVLVPNQESGPLDIVLQGGDAAPAAENHPVDGGEFPLVQAEGVVDGTTFEGPPFEPGTVLSIFGKRFGADKVVRIGNKQAEILYESATQINVRLPGELPSGTHDLTVTTEGRASEPYPIEVAR